MDAKKFQNSVSVKNMMLSKKKPIKSQKLTTFLNSHILGKDLQILTSTKILNFNFSYFAVSVNLFGTIVAAYGDVHFLWSSILNGPQQQ